MPNPRGRPRRPDPASHIVNFRCTVAERIELRRVADETGRHISGVVRDAVDEWVGDYRDRLIFRKTKK